MKEVMFRYDYPTREWVRTEDEAFTGKPPENLESIVVMNLPASRVVWCEEHQAGEKVAEWRDGELTTEDGCRMRGLVCEIPYPERSHWYDPPLERVSRVMRWRVSYREEDGTVLIFSDVAQIVLGYIYDNKKKTTKRIPKVRGFACKSVMLRLSPIVVLPKKCEPEIPSPVADTALEFLVEDAERRFGARPQLPKGIHDELFANGWLRLKAFLEWPFHMELMVLRPYFRLSKKDLEELGHDASDIFPVLCRRFKMPATLELREALMERPLAVPITAALKRHGVRKFSLARQFFRLPALFGEPLFNKDGGEYLPIGDSCTYSSKEYSPELFEDEAAMRQLCQSRSWYTHGFEASIFYAQWRLHREGEEKLAQHLLALNEHWEPRYKNAIATFYLHYPDIPEDVREDILRKGFTVGVQNRMIAAVNRIKLGVPDFPCSPEAKSYECRIGLFSFRLVKSRAELEELGKRLHSNGALPQNNAPLRFAVYRGDKPVAFLTVRESLRIITHTEGTGFEQTMQKGEIHIACLRWLKWTGLYKRLEPFMEEEWVYLDEDVRAEPLEPDDKEESLYDMMTLPEEEIREGYYTRFHQILMEVRPLLFVADREMCGDEMAFLMRLLPCGERIYRAAFSGNREAQMVLSECYDGGSAYSTLFADKEEEQGFIDALLAGKVERKNIYYKERAAFWRQQAGDIGKEKE